MVLLSVTNSAIEHLARVRPRLEESLLSYKRQDQLRSALLNPEGLSLREVGILLLAFLVKSFNFYVNTNRVTSCGQLIFGISCTRIRPTFRFLFYKSLFYPTIVLSGSHPSVLSHAQEAFHHLQRAHLAVQWLCKIGRFAEEEPARGRENVLPDWGTLLAIRLDNPRLWALLSVDPISFLLINGYPAIAGTFTPLTKQRDAMDTAERLLRVLRKEERRVLFSANPAVLTG
jgi:hypothetical protein